MVSMTHHMHTATPACWEFSQDAHKTSHCHYGRSYTVLLEVLVLPKGKFVSLFTEELVPHDSGILLVYLTAQKKLLGLQSNNTSDIRYMKFTEDLERF